MLIGCKSLNGKRAVGRRCDTTVHLSHTATRFLGDLLYDIFVSLNILIKAVRRLFKLPYWSLAAHIHCKVPALPRALHTRALHGNVASLLGLRDFLCLPMLFS